MGRIAPSGFEHMTSRLWAKLFIHRATLKHSGSNFEVPIFLLVLTLSLSASACPLSHPGGRRTDSSP